MPIHQIHLPTAETLAAAAHKHPQLSPPYVIALRALMSKCNVAFGDVYSLEAKTANPQQTDWGWFDTLQSAYNDHADVEDLEDQGPITGTTPDETPTVAGINKPATGTNSDAMVPTGHCVDHYTGGAHGKGCLMKNGSCPWGKSHGGPGTARSVPYRGRAEMKALYETLKLSKDEGAGKAKCKGKRPAKHGRRDYSDYECRNCGKKGHIARECRSTKKRKVNAMTKENGEAHINLGKATIEKMIAAAIADDRQKRAAELAAFHAKAKAAGHTKPERKPSRGESIPDSDDDAAAVDVFTKETENGEGTHACRNATLTCTIMAHCLCMTLILQHARLALHTTQDTNQRTCAENAFITTMITF